METPWCEKLSAQDRSFLVFEQRTTHMHLGGVAVLELAPLRTPTGGVQIERIRNYIASRLPLIPRYRQRLAFRPIDGAPFWVDDDRFNIDYHVRHAALPRPGDEGQLKLLAGRVLSMPLDRSRPLWEAWVVEGLEGDRFAMILKTHHAVVDGVSGVDLMSTLLQSEPVDDFAVPVPWHARPAPTAWGLWEREIWDRLDLSRSAFDRLRQFVRDPARGLNHIRDNLQTTLQFISEGLHTPAATPFNRPIGPYRRFDWQVLPLDEVKAIKNRLGGTVNDVVLATVAGAVRRYLLRKGTAVEGVDFRVVVPVSIRGVDEFGQMGNRVSGWLLSLPIGEAEPRRRYREVVAATERCKASHVERGIEVFTRLAEVMDPLLTVGVRVASRVAPYNLIVTNVPGPQFPLFLLGSRLLAGYPTVPLFEHQGLGVAIFSYSGQLFFGLNADWEVVSDLGDFSLDLQESFRELRRAAEGEVVGRVASARARGARRRGSAC